MTKVFQVDDGGTLTNGLQAYYKLDESSDGSGAVTRIDFFSTHDLTDNNTVPSGTGQVGNDVDATAANSEYLNADNFMDNPTDMTVAFWAKYNIGATRFLVTKTDDTWGTATPGWMIIARSAAGERIQWFIQEDASNYQIWEGTTDTDDGNWHFIIVTKNGLNPANIYIDNGNDEATDGGSMGTPDDLSNADNLTLFAQGGLGSGFLDGEIDELGFWNRALTSQERTDLWNSGNGQTMIEEVAGNKMFLMF